MCSGAGKQCEHPKGCRTQRNWKSNGAQWGIVIIRIFQTQTHTQLKKLHHPTPSLLHINIHPHLPKNLFANTRFIMPRSVSAAQAQYLVHFGLRTSSGHYPTPDHFSCTGAVFRAFEMFLFIVHFLCAGLFLMHRRSTSCILCCQRDPTIIQPPTIFHAQAQCFVHLGCFCQLCTGAVLRAFWVVFLHLGC